MTDQFYTNKDVAQKCVATLSMFFDLNDFDVCLEPSAGTGNFFELLPNDKRHGIDIEPKCEGVVHGDFLAFKAESGKTYIVVGNPPFGKISSLAIKFFNHAATFADVIAFVIPRTFKRISVQNRLNLNFHLVHGEDLPTKPCCFTPKMSAKCCFQVWEKRMTKREKIVLPTIHEDFEFLNHGPNDDQGQPTPPFGADFVIKAYGSNCGEVKKNGLEVLRPKSWHWVKSKILVDELVSRISKLDFSMSKDTVRQDSIGQAEFVQLYKEMYG
jgi:hypothetical protein